MKNLKTIVCLMFFTTLLGENLSLGKVLEKGVKVETIRLRRQLSQISTLKKNEDYDDVIVRLETFAKKHLEHDLAAEAHLEIANILGYKKKNIDAAIEKVKWVAANFPKAKKRQYHTFGWIPNTMYVEWGEYVNNHPILIKDYAWFKLAELYKKSKRYEDALVAYNQILSTVKPNKLPDTKNQAIVITFRLNKDALKQKIALLKKMKMKDEAKKATADFEKLYPKAAWKKLRLEACAAFPLYLKESKRLKELKEQEVQRRIEEEDKQHTEK